MYELSIIVVTKTLITVSTIVINVSTILMLTLTNNYFVAATKSVD